MERPTAISVLLTSEANVRLMAKSAQKPINVSSLLERIRLQRSQITPVNGGNPITGEGITK